MAAALGVVLLSACSCDQRPDSSSLKKRRTFASQADIAVPLSQAASTGREKIVSFSNEPEAEALYREMVHAYRSAASLQYTSQQETSTAAGRTVRHSYRMQLKKPNQFRMECFAAGGETTGVLIGDGEELWIYWPQGRPRWEYVRETPTDEVTRYSSYMTKTAPLGEHSILHEAVFLGNVGMPIFDPSTFHGHVDSIAGHFDAARRLADEPVSGEDCSVVEISWLGGQRTWRLWLSNRDHLPRRLQQTVRVRDDVKTREEWSEIEIGGSIDASRFTWSPPADWKPWSLPDDSEKLLLIGSMAPDFTLPGTDGRPVRLSDYRGTVLILYFWRVGCPPCRETSQALKALAMNASGDSLSVLGVNVVDDPDVARVYLSENAIPYRNVVDDSEAATTLYFETYGNGTVPLLYVIDREGRVLDRWFGHDEQHLGQALRAAGLGLD
jgi:peroxiredoxin/outer membrane lipoprotein-sorting protein